jgi:hypothetical protein
MIVDQSRKVSAAQASAAALEDHRAAALARIRQVSGETRARYISVIPGQEMIYLAKEAEASAFVAGEPGDYPFLSAEVGETGETLDQVAQVVLNLAAGWRMIGANIEALRVRANAAVLAAETIAEIDAAFATFRTGIAAW